MAATETVVDPVSGLTFEVTTSGRNVTGVDFAGGSIPADGVIDIPSSISYNGETVDVTGISPDLNSVNPSYRSSVTALHLPQGVDAVAPGLFAGYKVLKEVDIDGDAELGSKAFYGCAELGRVSLASGITAIPDSCFMGCVSLSSITLPSELETIGADAFCNAGLTEAVIPGMVSDVGDEAFKDCPLISVVIEGGAMSPVPTELGNYAFSAASVESVLCYRPVPPVLYGTGTTFKMSTYKDAYLQLLGDAEAHVADYEADKYWGWFGRDKPIYTAVKGVDAGQQPGVFEVYDINGVLRLRTSDPSLPGLAKGVYVVNGHKRVI